jgi:hypothetical protein
MKRIKLLVGLLVALMFLGAVSASTVSAQALDGVWLKCKVTAKGHSVDNTGAYHTDNGNITAYLHFVWVTDHYDFTVYTFFANNWSISYTDTVTPVLPNENFISDFEMVFKFNEGTDFIDTYSTPFITYKLNNGVVSKVSFKGTGEVFNGRVAGDTMDYYGYFNISGSSVDSSKLPFSP